MAVQARDRARIDRLLILIDGQPARPDPAALTPYRARLYRLILLLAAAYNMAFGAWAGFWPRSFFDVFQLSQPTNVCASNQLTPTTGRVPRPQSANALLGLPSSLVRSECSTPTPSHQRSRTQASHWSHVTSVFAMA